MPNYYLDIEATGLDPVKDKIITIQYVELDRNTCEQIGELTILKEWELGGEKELIRKFIQDSRIVSSYDFDFVSVGYNLSYEHKFLSAKSKQYSSMVINVMLRPHIDFHHIAVLLNRGEFKGTKLSDMTTKEQDGSDINKWYTDKEYDKIDDYIKKETAAFVDFGVKLYKNLPSIRDRVVSQ